MAAHTSSLSGKRVAILATDGVEQVELTEPRKALDSAGALTKVVSPKPGSSFHESTGILDTTVATRRSPVGRVAAWPSANSPRTASALGACSSSRALGFGWIISCASLVVPRPINVVVRAQGVLMPVR